MESIGLPRLEMCSPEHCAPNRIGRAVRNGCVFLRIGNDMKVVRR